MFTSIDVAVEVDVDLVCENERKRSTKVVKMKIKLTLKEVYSCCLNLFLFSSFYFWASIFL